MLTEKNWRVTSVSAGLAGSGFPFQGDPLELWRWWEAGSEERQRQEPTREGPAWQLYFRGARGTQVKLLLFGLGLSH